jgi:hypothetical protein
MTYKVGQIVYWRKHDVMRCKVLEVISRRLRETKYRVQWIDENNGESIHNESDLVSFSFNWYGDERA